MATPDILQAALTALSEGRLDEARQGFERVLAAEPDNPTALHWVAVIAYQQGAAPDAILGQIDRAIALDGDQALFHNSRGALLYALGRDLDAYRAQADVGFRPGEICGRICGGRKRPRRARAAGAVRL